MELLDDKLNVDSDNECDNRRLLLKKNLSWTNSDSIARSSTLKTSRSNPHVLEDVRSLGLKLATSQFMPKALQAQAIPSDDPWAAARCSTLARSVSPSALTAATTHQTLATPSSIQLNIQPNFDYKLYCRATLRHCKVNSQLDRIPKNVLFVTQNSSRSEKFHLFELTILLPDFPPRLAVLTVVLTAIWQIFFRFPS